jgi:hypothetical protein
MSSIALHNLPFCVKLACNQYKYVHALLCKLSTCTVVFSSGNELLHHIQSSGNSSQIHGYLIHCLCFKDSSATSTFWQLQLIIISHLQSLCNLQMVMAIIIPDHDRCCNTTFSKKLKSAGWCMSKLNNESFPNLGDTILRCCILIIGVHSSCTYCVEPLELKMPLACPLHPISAFLWEPFNRPEHSVSLAWNNNDFCCQDRCKVQSHRSVIRGANA